MTFGRLALFFLGIALVLFVMWLAIVFRQQRSARNVTATSMITIKTSSGEVGVPVELAITMAERTQGLSDKESLSEGSGMLFVWNENINTYFVMRRMNFPLDIIFIKGLSDGVGEILSISNDLPACPGKTAGCTVATAPDSFQYALEVDAGFAERNDIKVGDKTKFSQ